MAVTYERGDLVWAKIRGFPWWPAMILSPCDCFKLHYDIDDVYTCYTVILFGDHYVSQIKKENLKMFKDGFVQKFQKNSHKEFVTALEEAFNIFAEINELNPNFAEILKWSENCFEGTFTTQFRWTKKDLPQAITASLKRKYEINDMKAVLVRLLQKRNLNLGDICIACGTNIYELTHNFPENIIFQHPLFLGSICLFCVSNVAKALYLPPEQVKDFCIVCGSNNNCVLHCSKEGCSKSYCHECIESLDHEKAFDEITENFDWWCYFCKPVDNPLCYIQKRLINGDEFEEASKLSPQYIKRDDEKSEELRSEKSNDMDNTDEDDERMSEDSENMNLCPKIYVDNVENLNGKGTSYDWYVLDSGEKGSLMHYYLRIDDSFCIEKRKAKNEEMAELPEMQDE